jgi:UDP-galactopyranose mutase
MLFKKRERRKDVMRSFTLPGGLRSAVEAILLRPGIEVKTGRTAVRLQRPNEGFRATLDDGSSIETSVLALAVPPGAAASLLRGVAPELAEKVAAIREVRVDSLGFALSKEKASLPYTTFLIPLKDAFHSVVTRDVVPDPERRGFAFHFRPGHTREERIRRAGQVLRVRSEDMEAVAERAWVLPSPTLGHAETVGEIDRLLAGATLSLTGNWFGGLSIEDCVIRSRSEWTRIATSP